jgi:hypothetical protein
MNRNFKTLILSSSLVVASISVQAGMNQNITYYKPDPKSFIYSTWTQGLVQCGSNSSSGGGAIEGYGGGSVSNVFTVNPIDWTSPSNTLSFSGSPSAPQPMQWEVSPFDQCISYPTGGDGLKNDSKPDVVSGVTRGTITYHYSASQGYVYQVTTTGNLSDFLPPNMTYTDNSTGVVTQLKFAGCSDYMYDSNIINCCYTTDGSSTDCQVNK